MLRDEAIEALLSRLQDESVATLTIHVDHGLFRASLTAATVTRGEAEATLTDAVVSLAEAVDA